MQFCHPATFETYIDDEGLLSKEDLAVELLSESTSIFGWTPGTPGPPPIYTARLSNQFVTRAPVRLTRPDNDSMPVRQDSRQTRNTEQTSIIFNALLRRVEIIRVGPQDFRLSWIPPQFAGSDAPNGTLFLDTSTGLLSIKDVNGVVIPIGSGGTISLDFGGP